jgi:hypothetical protein
MATPAELRALIKQAEAAMKEMDSLRGKAEIPTWEKKELKEQRALARGRKEWAKKQLASQAKSPAPKAQATKKTTKKAVPSKPKTATPKTAPRVRGGGGMRGPINLGGGGGAFGKIK